MKSLNKSGLVNAILYFASSVQSAGLYVCLFACLCTLAYISWKKRPNFIRLLVTCDHGSVFLKRQCDKLCNYEPVSETTLSSSLGAKFAVCDCISLQGWIQDLGRIS